MLRPLLLAPFAFGRGFVGWSSASGSLWTLFPLLGVVNTLYAGGY